MKMEIDVLCILQNIVYGYFFITSFYIQLLLLIPVPLTQFKNQIWSKSLLLNSIDSIIKSLFHSDGILRFP